MDVLEAVESWHLGLLPKASRSGFHHALTALLVAFGIVLTTR
jgi:hypothetical protein